MLRLEFTTEDLARLRVESTCGPLVETGLALRAAQPGDKRAILGGWRQRLATEPASKPSLQLTELFPRLTYLDLIGLVGNKATLEEGIDAFLGRTAREFDEEINFGIDSVGRAIERPSFRPPPWVRGLAERRSNVRAEVAADLAAFHRTAVAPYWPRIQSRLNAEHSRLVWMLAQQGAEAVLRSLHPTIRWEPPHLFIDGLKGSTLAVPLGGRGLTIVPSFFCSPAYPPSVDVVDPNAPYMLLYPAVSNASDALSIWQVGPPGHKALAALLGHTRARVLLTIAERPCTTNELAERAFTSPASASQHASVLRNAGLITTQREGPSVCHRLTVLGVDLIG
jgi:DNA-binding transcriptional ArsR family regulator